MSMMIHRAVLRMRAKEAEANKPMPSPVTKELPKKEGNAKEPEKRQYRKRKG